MAMKLQIGLFSQLLVTLLAGSLLLSACSPTGSSATVPDPTVTSAPIATLEPTATFALAGTEIPASNSSPQIALDTGTLASAIQTETVSAMPVRENAPYWEMLPEYTRVTLQGYPISGHLMKPQIFIYPIKDLGEVNEGARQIVTSLQTLLQSPHEVSNMPFLPLFNAAQVIHVQVQYLDFKSGQGLRYLTEFDQGILPVNNNELIYTYQGLTGDGKYYVAAVLPVNHPSLPADGNVTGNEPPEFTSDFPAYLANVTQTLESQAAYSFNPDLARLDAMLSSLEIK